jgi:CDP-glycerol glycerophosphotransferase (TagB/SpsB family)
MRLEVLKKKEEHMWISKYSVRVSRLMVPDYFTRMAQDVLSVYETYYEKAVLHCSALKQQINDQTEHLRNLAQELGDSADFTLPEGTLNTQIEYTNERVDALEHI